MEFIKSFLFTLIAVCMLSCSSCGSSNKVTEPTYSASITSVRNLGVDTLTVIQLDSLTKADKLPVYAKWNKSYMKDGDNNKSYEYTTIFDKTTGIIYTVKYLRDDKVYVVQKRKTTSK